MSKIRLIGETSGYVDLAPNSVANNNTIKLPDSGDTLVAQDASGNVSVSGIITATGASISGILTSTSASISGATTTSSITVSGITSTSNLIVENSAYNSISTTAINKTLVNRELCTVLGIGTIAGLTITLPATPSSGWEVGVAIGGSFTDTVIGRNGSNIMGYAENLTVDKAYATLRFVYTDTTGGWRIF